jgi:thioredoxin
MTKKLVYLFLVTFFATSLLNAQQISSKNFYQVLKNNKVVVVKFWASWCMPCSILKPEFHKAKKIVGKRAKFVEYNVDLGGEPLNRYNIKLLPTMVIFKNGKEVSRDSSVLDSQAIADWVSNYTN